MYWQEKSLLTLPLNFKKKIPLKMSHLTVTATPAASWKSCINLHFNERHVWAHGALRDSHHHLNHWPPSSDRLIVGYQGHQEQKNSPLINHGFNLLMTLTASATSLTAYRATQLRLILTALTGFGFHFLCTFVWSSCQVSNGRQHSDKHYAGVWMSSLIKLRGKKKNHIR